MSDACCCSMVVLSALVCSPKELRFRAFSSCCPCGPQSHLLFKLWPREPLESERVLAVVVVEVDVVVVAVAVVVVVAVTVVVVVVG